MRLLRVPATSEWGRRESMYEREPQSRRGRYALVPGGGMQEDGWSEQEEDEWEPAAKPMSSNGDGRRRRRFVNCKLWFFLAVVLGVLVVFLIVIPVVSLLVTIVYGLIIAPRPVAGQINWGLGVADALKADRCINPLSSRRQLEDASFCVGAEAEGELRAVVALATEYHYAFLYPYYHMKCTGAAVSQTEVLTAAHCVVHDMYSFYNSVNTYDIMIPDFLMGAVFPARSANETNFFDRVPNWLPWLVSVKTVVVYGCSDLLGADCKIAAVEDIAIPYSYTARVVRDGYIEYHTRDGCAAWGADVAMLYLDEEMGINTTVVGSMDHVHLTMQFAYTPAMLPDPNDAETLDEQEGCLLGQDNYTLTVIRDENGTLLPVSNAGFGQRTVLGNSARYLRFSQVRTGQNDFAALLALVKAETPVGVAYASWEAIVAAYSGCNETFRFWAYESEEYVDESPAVSGAEMGIGVGTIANLFVYEYGQFHIYYERQLWLDTNDTFVNNPQRPGDSGSPLLVERAGRFEVVGVLEGGSRFTAVAPFLHDLATNNVEQLCLMSDTDGCPAWDPAEQCVLLY